MRFIIVSADLPYFESVYCWYNLTPNFTNPLSLCVKVFPSLWSALLSALRLEKEGFKATPAINSKKQSFRSLYLLFSFLSMFWFISDLGFLFKKKKISYICLSFCWNLYFCFFCELVHVLFRSFSCTPFQPSNTISHITLILFFFFFFRQHSALFVHIPPDIFFCSSLLFYPIVILVVLNYELWFDFHLIWFEIFCQFLVPLALSFLFSSFLVVGCRQLMTWSGYLLHFWRQLEL